MVYITGDDKCSHISYGVVVLSSSPGAYEMRIIKGFNEIRINIEARFSFLLLTVPFNDHALKMTLSGQRKWLNLPHRHKMSVLQVDYFPIFG